jgi:hypothetical protein
MPAPIVGDLLDLFPDEIVLEHAPAPDNWGDFSSSGYTTVSPNPRARIVDQVVMVKGPNNVEVKSTQHVVLAGVFNVKIDSRITLPSRFEVRQPKIVAYKQPTDENGPHHEKVFF